MVSGEFIRDITYSFLNYIELTAGTGAHPLVFCVGGYMANEKNLKPFTSDQSREEAVKNGRKGGIRSGEVKRENKLIKDRILERMGESDWDVMIDNLIARAQEDTKSFETLRDTLGQKPKESVSIDAPTEIIVTRKRRDEH